MIRRTAGTKATREPCKIDPHRYLIKDTRDGEEDSRKYKYELGILGIYMDIREKKNKQLSLQHIHMGYFDIMDYVYNTKNDKRPNTVLAMSYNFTSMVEMIFTLYAAGVDTKTPEFLDGIRDFMKLVLINCKICSTDKRVVRAILEELKLDISANAIP